MHLKLPKLIIFASGSKDGGGSGFQKLVEATGTCVLGAEIVAVVSNHEHGGVRKRADALGIRFVYSPKGRTADDYRRIIQESGADYTALSGWLGKIEGHDPRTTFNIHPALLPSPFGGQGFYGHHVHEAVIAAYKRDKITHTGVTMHFATAKYDDPSAVFFQRQVEILPDDTPDTIAQRVNQTEHSWQARITDLVVTGVIKWDGVNTASIQGASIE